MRQLLTVNGAEHEIGLTRPGPHYRLLVGDDVVDVGLMSWSGDRMRLDIGGRTHDLVVAVEGDIVHLHLDGAVHAIRWTDPVTRHGSTGSVTAADVATAPMPGTVVAVFVEPGREVAAGEQLLVIESMKLETTIRAGRAGRVAMVHVGQGATFERGAALVGFEPEPGPRPEAETV